MVEFIPQHWQSKCRRFSLHLSSDGSLNLYDRMKAGRVGYCKPTSVASFEEAVKLAEWIASGEQMPTRPKNNFSDV